MAVLEQVLLHCLDNLDEPILIIGRNQKSVLFANASFCSLIGANPGSLTGITLGPSLDNFWPTYQETQSKEITVALNRNSSDSQASKVLVKMLRRNLSFGTESADLFKVVAAQIASDDQQLYHAQRLETLGMLAGAIAHDFNNVLTGILGHTTYLKAILPQGGPHVESLTAIEDGTKKGTSLTQQVLNFSKLDSVSGAIEVPLCDLVNKTINLVRKAIPYTLKLETSMLCPETWVLAVEGQLMQALVNLVMNARDAIESEGQIRILLAHEIDTEKLNHVFNGADLTASRYAVLSVQDTGSGIPDEYIGRVFERFFTTKRDKGTGLGLSTVFDIAQSLGGTVTLSSKVGAGTSISIYLPIHRTADPQDSKTQQATDLDIQKGSEHILIVDDEAPVRNILAVSLQHLGYKVTAVESALIAVEKIKNEGLPYDLIISDMLMPGMSGDQFFEYLFTNHAKANVPFLVISGYSAEGSVKKLLKTGAAGFLAKPFTIEELSREVRRIFDAK